MIMPGGPPPRPFRDEDRPGTWRERFAAMRHLPRMLRLVWETQPAYTVGVVCIRVASAVVPLALLWIGKLIVDDVVLAVNGASAGNVGLGS